MNLSNRRTLVTALTAGLIGAAGVIAACSSSNGSGSTGGTGSTEGDGGVSTTPVGDGGGGSVNNTTAGSCANATIPILFAPMYSAFITDSNLQTFQVPAVTTDGNTASWSSSEPTAVQLAPDSTTGGVLVTVIGKSATGSVQIFAAEGSACGSSTLNITANVENDWATGNSRYNDGVAVHIGRPDGGGFHIPDGGFPEGGFVRPEAGAGMGFNEDAGSIFEEDGGTACVNCHGPTALGNSGFINVAHTPEQTGGFSDSELISIIVDGVIPDGGYFDPSVLNANCDAGTVLGPNMAECGQRAYQEWQSIHRWADITTDEQPGIVCYLRSLTPVAQGGSSDFGGGTHGHRDGGGPGGGGGGGGGGGAGNTDSGGGGGTTSDDSGTSGAADATGE